MLISNFDEWKQVEEVREEVSLLFTSPIYVCPINCINMCDTVSLQSSFTTASIAADSGSLHSPGPQLVYTTPQSSML